MMAPQTRGKKLKTTYVTPPAVKDAIKPVDDFEATFYSDTSSSEEEVESDADSWTAMHNKRKRKRQIQRASRKNKKSRKANRKSDPVLTIPTLSDQDDNFDGETTLYERDLDFSKNAPKHDKAGRSPSQPLIQSFHSEDSPLTLSMSKLASKVVSNRINTTSCDSVASTKTVVRFNMGDLHVQATKLGIATTADIIAEIGPDGGLKMVKASHQNGTVAVVPVPKFDQLPDTILHEIYRYVFTSDTPIMFNERRNFSRSSALLRVCSRFHDGGTKTLYGENSFHFARKHDNRGRYWEQEWKEIGYTDVRRFMEAIGLANIAKMRYISIQMEDAMPCVTSYMSEFERRFVNDGNLLRILELVGKNTTLEKFIINLQNRKSVDTNDYHFLKHMSNIKCHEFTTSAIPGPRHKFSLEVEARLRRLMEIPRSSDIDARKKQAPKMKYDSTWAATRAGDW